jgi:hypothetical protein
MLPAESQRLLSTARLQASEAGSGAAMAGLGRTVCEDLCRGFLFTERRSPW